MKRLMIAALAAAAFATPALAQMTPAQPAPTTTPDPAMAPPAPATSMTTPDPAMAPAPATTADANMSAPAAAAAPMPADGAYPRCSKTVTDHCTERSNARGQRMHSTPRPH